MHLKKPKLMYPMGHKINDITKVKAINLPKLHLEYEWSSNMVAHDAVSLPNYKSWDQMIINRQNWNTVLLHHRVIGSG